MQATDLTPSEATSDLAAAFNGDTKVAVRSATFRECIDGTSDKCVGVIVLEFLHPQTARRSLGCLRVYCARAALRPMANRWMSGISITSLVNGMVPGCVSPGSSPFRIGGMSIAHCATQGQAHTAALAISGYGAAYLKAKARNGYSSEQGSGIVGEFLHTVAGSLEHGSVSQWTIPYHPHSGGSKIITGNPQAFGLLGSQLNSPPLASWITNYDTGEPAITPPPPDPVKRVMDVGSMFSAPRKRININRKP